MYVLYYSDNIYLCHCIYVTVLVSSTQLLIVLAGGPLVDLKLVRESAEKKCENRWLSTWSRGPTYSRTLRHTAIKKYNSQQQFQKRKCHTMQYVRISYCCTITLWQTLKTLNYAKRD
jgi:hypothetical protein